MIAHWPQGIRARGELSGFTSHLVDLMPTVVELAGAEYPTTVDGIDILPMEGESLVPALQGKATFRSRPLYWEFAGNHAVRNGNWKLVAERSREWELYDLSSDRSETLNLVDKEPKRFAQLSKMYDAWAKRTGAKSHKQAAASKPSSQSQLFDLEKLLKQKTSK